MHPEKDSHDCRGCIIRLSYKDPVMDFSGPARFELAHYVALGVWGIHLHESDRARADRFNRPLLKHRNSTALKPLFASIEANSMPKREFITIRLLHFSKLEVGSTELGIGKPFILKCTEGLHQSAPLPASRSAFNQSASPT